MTGSAWQPAGADRPVRDENFQHYEARNQMSCPSKSSADLVGRLQPLHEIGN
ncbi:MAG: hypothetical protein JWQ95_135 [Sphaerisporangium sp.]|jgi:hypothetical protein|nr:hypothetical protein [Sphaerisporangium sp.]